MKLKSYTNKDRYGNMTSFEFYEGASVDMGDVPPMMQGIPDHPGDPKGTDTVPAWLTPGEFVMNAEATRMFEPQIEQMNNAGRAVQAQQGGTIPQYEADGGPIYAAAGGNSGFLANILKRLEGVKNEAYLDSAGKATIGAGSTRGVQMGDTASDDQVDSMLAEDIAVVDQDYGQLVSADLNTNQEAAVKSLLFNIGGPQFANSKARAALNAGDFESFKKEAAEFRKVGDEVIPGLENRRAQELALFDSPVGQDPWGINKRQVSTRDDRVAKLNTAGQPTDLAMQAAILGQDAETTGEIVTPPPVDRGPPSVMSMISGEEQNAFQRDVEAAQKATREKGMYDPDGNMEAIQAGIDQAQILEDQRRMQQGQVPPVVSTEPSVETEDTRNAFRKFGDAGGLMGAISRGTDNLNEIKEKFQKENTEQNRVNKVLLEQDRMQQGQVPDLKEPPKDLPDNLVFNQETGKVEYKDPSTAPTTGLLNAIEGPEGARAQALKLKTAEEEVQTAIANGYGPGDPIFDGALERRDALKGADKKLADLEDQKTSVFTEGELKVTEAEAEKKQKQADKLVELGLSEEAKKVQADADDLKAKQKRLEGKSQELVKDDQTEALDPAVPTMEGISPGGSTTSTTTTPETIANDKEFPDDKTVPKNTTPEDATKAGETAPPEQVNKAESFLSDIFGDLFDKGELKRMAIMYVGGRMLGGSHNGSLNFAAKAYVKRVDSKVSAHDKYVKQLTKDGLYKPSSIAKYKKTKNLSDLEKKDATYSATGGASITKMIPVKGGGFKQTTVVPVKNSITNEISYRAVDGTILPAEVIANSRDYRPELKIGTEEYNVRRDRVYNQMEKSFKETRDNPENYELDGKTKVYYTNVGPAKAAREFFAWAESVGQDPESTQSMDILTMAQEQMIEEAKGKKFRPTSLTPYLEYQMIREETTAPELFLLNPKEMAKGKPPKMIRMDQMQSLYQNIDHLIHSRGNKTTRDAMFAKGVQNWQSLPQSERDKYNKGAEKDVGINGFYNFMQDTMAAVKAKEPKT